MHGDVVKASKWLGGSLVVATLVAVIGFHPAVTGRTVTVGRIPPADDPRPAQYLAPAPAAYPAMVSVPAGRCDVAGN